MKISNQEYIKRVSEINPTIKPIEEYKGRVVKIKHQCNICEYIWSVLPQNIYQGTGCPHCWKKKRKSYLSKIGEKQRISNEEYVEKLKNRLPNILPLTEYINAKTKMKFKCLVCGYEWEALPLWNRDEFGCHNCAQKARSKRESIDQEEFLERLRKCSSHVELIAGYSCISKKATFKCLKCNNIWDAVPNKILHGRGCPKCKMSHGEKEVENILKELNIKYEKQKIFKECKHITYLKFDFYLEDYNTCVEYDGIQHYKSNAFFGKNKNSSFEDLNTKDNIKNDFCKNNGIDLLRIPYTEKNIKEKIQDFLKDKQ